MRKFLFFEQWKFFKTWVCFSIRVLMRSHFFWKKNKQQNQSIYKILRGNISSESMWKMKGLTTLLFLVNILVLCGTICKTVSVFSSHRIGTWKDHTEVWLEFLPKRDRWLELPFFAVAGIFCSPRRQKDYFVSKTDIFFSKKTLPILLKMILRNKWKRVLFGKLIQRSLEKGKIR